MTTYNPTTPAGTPMGLAAEFRKIGESSRQASDLVAGLQGDVTTLQGDVTTLQGDVTTLQGDVTTLSANKVSKAGDTMTGPLLLPNGTAGAPALSFSGDTDTGVCHGVGADELVVVTGGTGRFSVSNSLVYSANPLQAGAGLLGTNVDVTGYVQTPGAYLGSTAGAGMAVRGYQTGGGAYVGDVLSHNPNHGNQNLYSIHVVGSWVGWILRTSTASQVDFNFQNNGYGYAVAGWTTFSDRRLKTGIKPIKNAVARVNNITGCTYTRTDVSEYDGSRRRVAGLIAQDLIDALPEAIHKPTGKPPAGFEADTLPTLAVDFNAVTALLIQAVKEVDARLVATEDALATTRAQGAAMNSRITELEAALAQLRK